MNMKKMECECGAMFRTGNEQELVEIAKIHGKRAHNMEMKDADIRKMIKPA